MSTKAISIMFLSILWLTSITHNSSIDIVSHPMGPVTWFNVRRWASYIISGAEFQQIHYRLSQPSKAPEPMLGPFPSLLPSPSSILITFSSLWPWGAQAFPWAFKSPRPWTQQWGWWSICKGWDRSVHMGLSVSHSGNSSYECGEKFEREKG